MRRLGVACLGLLLPLRALAADPPPTPTLQQPAAPASINPCGGTGPLLRPILATRTQPPYPAESQRLGEQGTTTLRVRIAPDGTVADASVATGSGSARLDTAALAFVKDTYRWETLACAVPVATLVRIVWSLRGAPPRVPIDPALLPKMAHFIIATGDDYPAGAPSMRAATLAVVVLGDDGQVGQVVIVRGSGNALLDERAQALIRARRWTPAYDGQRPVGSLISAVVVWSPPGQKPPDPEQLRSMLQMYMEQAPPPP